MKFNPDEIKEATKADFDKAWNEGKKYVSSPGINEKYPRASLKYGKPHPVFDTIQHLRDAYMRLGFLEFMNPVIMEDLRSHMTSGWFISLGEMIDYRKTPLKLFSVDRCFHREQAEYANLMAYYSASCVIMDENVSMDDGKAVAAGLLSQFGFSNFMFRPDEKRSKYYVPDTQTEVFACHPKIVGSKTKYKDGWVEVATFGIYSPSALSQYNIPYPVMNLGMDVERLAMILHDSTDVRALTYPQFQYNTGWVMSDGEIASMIYVEDAPATETGKDIRDAIVKTCEQYGDTPSPCEFTAWKGQLFDKNILVKVVGLHEENTKLCGPAAMNEVISNKNDILGLPRTSRWDDVFNNGVTSGIRYIDAFAERCAKEIENAVRNGSGSETKVRIIKVPSEINIRIDPIVQRYITVNKKKIYMRGPVFTTVKMEIL